VKLRIVICPIMRDAVCSTRADAVLAARWFSGRCSIWVRSATASALAWCHLIEAFDEQSQRHTQLALFPADQTIPANARALKRPLPTRNGVMPAFHAAPASVQAVCSFARHGNYARLHPPGVSIARSDRRGFIRSCNPQIAAADQQWSDTPDKTALQITGVVCAGAEPRADQQRACHAPAQAQVLWARLEEISGMSLKREELLMKLGTARSKARAAWRLLDIKIAPDSASFSYALNRKKLRRCASAKVVTWLACAARGR
jgi:hypothetical protein